MLWKDGLSKKFAPEHGLSVISGKMVFLFFKNYDIFSLGGKWKKMIFIKKRVEIWYFLYICVGVKSMTLPSWQKKTRMPLPRKNTPRVDISGITKIWCSSLKIWYFCWNTTLTDTRERAQEAATGDVLQ